MEELQFENTLEKDYKNPQFNAYLEEQPGANVEEYEDGRKSKIIIKNVRSGMSEKGIKNLCSEYGDVCSVVRGTASSHYFFVIFGSPDQAQYAIEKINRLYQPMRAEFAKSRQTSNYLEETKRLIENPPDLSSISISKNRVFQGPFVQKLQFKVPPIVPFLSAEEYKAEALMKVDDSLNFFNEFALCDILTEKDIDDLEANAQCYQMLRSILVYKPKENEILKIKKSLELSAGFLDEDGEVRIENHKGFEKYSSMFGKCKICGKVSVRQTKNTKEFYCSTLCKQSKIPNEASNESLPSEECELAIKEIHNRRSVAITAVINQNTVYVRPGDPESTTVYYRNLLKVCMLSENAALILKPPKSGDLVAINIIDEIYMRALVLKVIDSDHIRVAYLDTGAVSLQKLRNFRKLHDDLKKIPICVHKITLDAIPTDYINFDAIIYLNQFVCGEKARELEIRFDNLFEGAQLYDHNECVNDDLVDMISISIPTGEGVRNSEYIGHMNVKVNKEAEFIILDNSLLVGGELTCIQKEYFIKLQILHEKVQYYGSRIAFKEPYAPRHGEVCLVRLDGMWFRGICAEIVGDRHPTINCFDFGFYAIVVVDDIARIPDKLLDICYSNSYAIHGIDFDKHMPYIDKIRHQLSNLKTITAQKCTETTIYSKEIEELLHDCKNLPEPSENHINGQNSDPEVD